MIYVLIGEDTHKENLTACTYFISADLILTTLVKHVLNTIMNDQDVQHLEFPRRFNDNEVFHVKFDTIYAETKEPVTVEYIIYELGNAVDKNKYKSILTHTI